MATVLDTRKIAQRFEKAGMPEPQAAALIETLVEFRAAQSEELATKADILLLRSEFVAFRGEMEAKFDAFRGEMEAKSDALRAEMEAKFDALRAEMKAKFDALRGEMEAKFDALRTEVTSKLGAFRGQVIAAVALMLLAHFAAVYGVLMSTLSP